MFAFCKSLRYFSKMEFTIIRFFVCCPTFHCEREILINIVCLNAVMGFKSENMTTGQTIALFKGGLSILDFIEQGLY